MSAALLTLNLRAELDVLQARHQTRALAALLNFNEQDQIDIATAVFEVAHNAVRYGHGGELNFRIIGNTPPQLLEIIVKDAGPGIPTLAALDSQHTDHQLAGGIDGARQLMDNFSLESRAGSGTTVCMKKFLPPDAAVLDVDTLPSLTAQLTAVTAFDPITELRNQNRELMSSLRRVHDQHDDLERLNSELEDTNRGVVALYAELDERADRLRHSDELKSRFLSDMSHEFRTPLNSIMALSRLLLDRLDGDLSADQEKQVRFIRGSAETLTELVNDLLDLAKVEAGKIEVKPSEFSVEDLFGALRGMLKPLLGNDNVALVFDDVKDLPSLFADETKVAQILRNFISNAIKFTERGEVRVQASYATGAQEIVLSVSDTGIGIPPADIDNIFIEFVQLDNPAQQRHKGTGLGLPLSKKLAQLLKGDITVASQPHQGSTFSLHLPLRYSQQPAIEPLNVNTVTSATVAGVPILIVGDNAIASETSRHALERAGYAVTWARTSADVRRNVGSTKPAAIVLDMALPADNGWLLLASLKQDLSTKDIPLITIVMADEEQKAMAVGANTCLRKPLAITELLNALQCQTETHDAQVLLIEDEEAFRYITRQLLPAKNYNLIEAATGMEGIRIARSMPIDVLLLDMNLPEMSGIDILDALDVDASTRAIPVIVVSAASAEELAMIPAGRVHEVILKRDLSAEKLTTTITAALSQRRTSLARS